MSFIDSFLPSIKLKTILIQNQHQGLQKVVTSFLTNNSLKALFSKPDMPGYISVVLPITTVSVERSFSDMKLVKTRLRGRLGEGTLDQAMHICIEGPVKLSDDDLECIGQHWKEQKNWRL